MKTKIYFSQLLMVMILLGESTAVMLPGKLGQFLPEIVPQRSLLVVTGNCDNADDCDNDEEQVDGGKIQSYHLVQ